MKFPTSTEEGTQIDSNRTTLNLDTGTGKPIPKVLAQIIGRSRKRHLLKRSVHVHRFAILDLLFSLWFHFQALKQSPPIVKFALI